ncbi:MAG: hypothetical protein HY694_03880 [Deltaproteobacteria bacterium]|nr:hypothetical protein [Deltaproteobacteria bacterium]
MVDRTVGPCQYAIERHRNIAKWRNLWTILLFIFGSAVVVFLVGAILLFVRQDWLPGAISTLATIVNGVGIKWVYERRKEAVEEEEAAYKDVAEKCAEEIGSARVTQLLSQHATTKLLFGKFR